MNILAINPFKIANRESVQGTSTNPFQKRFGLTMAKPLSKDTVSFGCIKPASNKLKNETSFIITEALAKKIRTRKEAPHNRKKQILVEHFGDLINQGLISFNDRVKGTRSIREKATTNGLSSEKLVLEHMDDISGFAFVLNSAKAFSEVSKRLLKMLKNRELEITEGEYHRLAPKYKKNVIVESHDTIKPSELQKLKDEVNKVQNPTSQLFYDVDSRSGYSGLHLNLRSKDGEISELQIMVKNMALVKIIENVYYKIENGKSIDPKYELVEKLLAGFKPLEKSATEVRKKEHRQLNVAMTKYTQEVYNFAADHPFDPNFKILTVAESTTLTKKEKALLEKYGFDKIGILMEACEKMAETTKK